MEFWHLVCSLDYFRDREVHLEDLSINFRS